LRTHDDRSITDAKRHAAFMDIRTELEQLEVQAVNAAEEERIADFASA
jgi:hypothetical protein